MTTQRLPVMQTLTGKLGVFSVIILLPCVLANLMAIMQLGAIVSAIEEGEGMAEELIRLVRTARSVVATATIVAVMLAAMLTVFLVRAVVVPLMHLSKGLAGEVVSGNKALDEIGATASKAEVESVRSHLIRIGELALVLQTLIAGSTRNKDEKE